MSNNTYIIMLFLKNMQLFARSFVQKISRFVLKIIFSEQMLEVISRCLKRKNNKTPLYILHVFPFVL